jgi:nitrous oxide reductase accessory protein NosL
MTEEAVGHFCQMELLEHPGPKAQAHLDGLPMAAVLQPGARCHRLSADA